MKKLLLLIVCALLSSTASFAIVSTSTTSAPQFSQAFGQQLTLKQQLTFKVAQKAVKAQNPAKSDISKGLYIVLTIFGLGWLAIGLASGWESEWWKCLLWSIFTLGIGGLIYAFVKMKNYY